MRATAQAPLLSTKVALLALIAVGAVAAAASSGCGKGDTSTTRASRRGEACQVTNDCLEGLACSPIPGGAGGLCVTGDFHVRVTAKECAVVECAAASDCCDASLAAGCAQLRMLCFADAGFSSVQACNQYFAQCGCESGRIDCEVGKCVSKCSLDSDCLQGGSGRRCSGSKCVQCASDGDCPGQQCTTGACQVGCSTDGDCTGFDRCVGGRCLASGCQTDRECVAVTRNVDARCGTDGKCIVPCETDLECGNPTDYTFFSCIDKECTYVGCETDKDCRLFYSGLADASVGANQHAVCRDRGIIGDVVKTTP